MFESFVMVLVGLVGGAASVMGTLPAVLVALFGDTSVLNTTPSGADISGPNLVPPLLPFANQTFQSGGQNYHIALNSSGEIHIIPGEGPIASTTTTTTPPSGGSGGSGGGSGGSSGGQVRGPGGGLLG